MVQPLWCVRAASRWLPLAMLVLWSCSFLHAHAGDAAERRVALVIGNSAYAGSPLANPVNDAMAIAEKLRSFGFHVITRFDAGQREMTRALAEFGDSITPGSVAMFYYAGHGIQSRGRNFLIPVDADIRSENGVSAEAVDVERVLDQLDSARLSMVVLDACRNNPFEGRFRSGAGRGLAQIDAPTGTLIAYATAPGKVALDGDGRQHAPYTEALLQVIDTPGLRVEDVFKQVRIRVLKMTRNQQIPWESSSLTGDFVFRPVAAMTNAPAARPDTAALSEQLARLSIEVSKLRESQQSPKGPASAHGLAESYAGDWKAQLAKVSAISGTPTFSGAMAALLDIGAPEDLAVLQAFEQEVNRRPFSSVFALGVDAAGFITWGGSYNYWQVAEASESAIQHCSRNGASNCRVVLANGSFDENAWREVASGLRHQPVDATRAAFMATLRRPPTQTSYFSRGRAFYGYTFSVPRR